MFVNATYDREKKTVHYFDENGNETLYIGGSFAWRTNNPGNLTKPTTYVMDGAIGYAQRTSTSKGRFVIFPDRATGMAAHQKVLKSVYGDSTIKGMITKYAPPSENNTDGYIDTVTKAAGVSSSDVVGTLSPEKFAGVTSAMEKQEGWVPGIIRQLGRPLRVQLFDKVTQPFADQKINIKSSGKNFETKSDANGQLPWLYSGLLGDEINLYYARENDDHEKIGTFSTATKAPAYTFTAPYYLLTAQPRVHEANEKFRPIVHIVRPGETLSSIASKHGTTVAAIVQENSLSDANHIYARQHVRIPRGGDGAGEATLIGAPSSEKSEAGGKKQAGSAKGSPGNGIAQMHAVGNGKSSNGSEINQQKLNVTSQRNQNFHPETIISSRQLELSGKGWCSRFPGLKSLDSLDSSFRSKVDSFFSALKEAGIAAGDIKIGATYRPPERSYLMYNAFYIAKGKISPDKVERFGGVNIDWVHRGADGKMDLDASKKAAIEMCGGYRLNLNSEKQVVGKAWSSRHNFGAAIDMNIYNFIGKTVKDADGNEVSLKLFSDLVEIGRSYGVRYFPVENMHWSDSGH
ncbi:LysM peptidoglycan-binding domain-containing protein [Paraburkholderia sp. HD33-4]|uniref:LysM peptidoglycan-binding domain-containing protein n=1 Tax=Paraburkholderia sp. HD33-4 TaxID=2883242 RepID=UPI001F35B7F5|nr:LysM peptidoglycan-binding domain-containing protein [Paraburkholderia sp. HD33-4]